jgi:hypothetical protein
VSSDARRIYARRIYARRIYARRIYGCPGMTPKPSKSLPASSEESPKLSATPREMRKVKFRT